MERVYATYWIETPLELPRAAETLAGEQSSGTFVPVPGETEELKQRFAARVESVELLGEVAAPSLPGAKRGSRYQQGRVVVSWSVENFGNNLPVLMSTLQGNLYELSQLSGLRLVDFEVPDSFANHFPGPRFGVSGTRAAIAAPDDRPMIGTIIKPSVGLSPDETAQWVRTLLDAGVDFVKDDELMGNPGHSPFDARVDAVVRVVHDYQERTGRGVMIAFNISDEWDAMQRHYDKLVAVGGTCAMLSVNSIGLAGVKKICDHGELVVHGHRNGWGMLNRYPALGTEFAAYQKFWRLAGVDQIHVNGIENKFWEPDDSVVRSIEACRKPLLNGKRILPVISSGQWGGQAPETFRRIGTVDLLYLAGGGIAAHPGGPAAGVRAIRAAWEGAVAGMTLEQIASQSLEVREAVEKFGGAHCR
ncbi:MAG: ribulose-bisphosphate carboxylase large subunit family protein [Pirellulaceae bacterium]|nr:ribulose-bisphosphate carboxylase large subunit family protein [Planctomycetales bacterium]